MVTELIKDIVIDQLLSSPAGQILSQAMDTITIIQRHILALADKEDSASLKLLRIGTVFQIFLIDTLASGKKPSEIASDDWINIADKVSQYAILNDGQGYSEFVFTLYADYIDVSIKCLQGKAGKESLESISELEKTIRQNTELLRQGELKESDYVEDCLWMSLEAMIKLLSASLTSVIGPDCTKLAEAVSQLAFEYGRYVLYAKEQAILESYIQNQYVLDEQLKQEYEAFLAELQENAVRFQRLLDEAFSPELHNSLLRSVALAREIGVKEKELLTSIDEIDIFFMD